MADNSSEHDDSQKAHSKSAESANAGPENAGMTETGAVTGYSPSLVGDSRLNTRGNSSVKATVMRQTQQTQGNRGVQRMLQRSVSVQRNTPAATPTSSATPTAAGNPLVAAMWEATVHQPVVQATADMQGNPSKAKMRDADSKLTNARATMHQTIAAVPSGPKNDLPIAQAKTVSNGLVAISKEIEPHIGQISPVSEIQPQLTTASDHVAQAGDALSKTDPTPAPAGGATPATPKSTAAPTPGATTQ